MRLSTKTRYGLRAMVNIARHDNGPVSSEVIANCESLSKKYLDGILGTLRRAGLIESYKGQGGGYRLSRDPADITAGEVVTVLEGGAYLTECVGDRSSCEKTGNCAARAFWCYLSSSMTKAMDTVTIDNLSRWKPGEELALD